MDIDNTYVNQLPSLGISPINYFQLGVVEATMESTDETTTFGQGSLKQKPIGCETPNIT